MKTGLFDYVLPPERIAQEPLAERDASRLLVLDRAARAWRDANVRDLPAFLRPGDLLVFNDTRVIPARLRARRDATGGQVEIFLLPQAPTAERASGHVVRRALTRSGGRLKPGETFSLPGNIKATMRERLGESGDVLEFSAGETEFEAFLAANGEVPLPPYIRRPPGPSEPRDRERYQTVFAAKPGAVAAPTAGLHFSDALLGALDAHGVQRTTVTLHVGPGTFKPVKAESAEAHRVDAEPFRVCAEAAQAVTIAKAEGRRVIPVGTTSLRVLETCWDPLEGALRAGAGETGLFIYPPYEFRIADALITNFHLPKSSLLMLAAAFASPGKPDGIDWLKAAYAHAIGQEYRFFSYGDACLIF